MTPSMSSILLCTSRHSSSVSARNSRQISLLRNVGSAQLGIEAHESLPLTPRSLNCIMDMGATIETDEDLDSDDIPDNYDYGQKLNETEEEVPGLSGMFH
ncbi:UNVERIFIED_CONTAM: hypothetical protein K2H54_060642 [Gekko kuhli]